MKPESIIVTVSDDRLSEIDEVAKRLEATGMRSLVVLPISGIITGIANEDLIGQLRKVWGVAAVERDGEMEAL
ncbi:MAG: hypothetical protein AAFU85_02630 [Planctomycetota bacterium]